MILNLAVLFLTPLLSGLAIFFVPKGSNTNFKLMLVFAGSYLFAITVIHILPELYAQHADFTFIGLFVLIGFFLQQLLEYFTSGIEHGHIHTTHEHHHSHHDHSHSHHHSVSAVVLLLALCVHAFLEGGMLTGGDTHRINVILLGIALHRAPAAFALMTVLAFQLHSRNKAIPYLVVFSLAAPAGLLLSTYLMDAGILSSTGLVYLYALVSGNFLHISTTIVFESSPEHRFHAKKMLVAIGGSMLAVVINYVVH